MVKFDSKIWQRPFTNDEQLSDSFTKFDAGLNSSIRLRTNNEFKNSTMCS